jgi:aspartate/methionine/tyrosine aminotransferase
MGYAAGSKFLIDEISKLQQQTFVCASSPMQHAMAGAYEIDLTEQIERFQKRRDMVVEKLEEVTDLVVPEGAFYAFVKVPEHLQMTGMEFISKAIEHNVLAIQGSVFSARDTHFRISYAVDEADLEKGLSILHTLLQSSEPN